MASSLRSRRQRICSICSQSFLKDEHLARHVRTHTREKPFVCAVCAKAFSRRDSLLRHARRHKTDSGQASEGPAPLEESSVANVDVPGPNDRAGTALQPSPVDVNQGHRPPSAEALDFMFSAHPSGVPPNSEYTARPAAPSGWLDTVVGLLEQPVSHPHQNPPALNQTTGRPNDHTDWNFGLVSQTPTWFAQNDFDLDALNSAILASTTSWLPHHDGQITNSNNNSTNNNNNTTEPMVCDTQPSAADARPFPKEELVRRRWFTFIGVSEYGYVTPDATAPEITQVDEAYRESLAVKLQQKICTSPLPSTDFLNLCIQMYFTKFDPVFPIVHAPTFRPSAKSALLLLSICSVGSLFVGSSQAASQGLEIFETLNKSILSSWERYLSGGGAEAVAMIQAAVIGQTFGLLSGNPKDLMTVQTFHGTVVAWARKYNMFKAKRASDYISPEEISGNPEKAWKVWAHTEEQNRLATGLHIHDVEISELCLTDPFLRFGRSKLPLVADDDLWAAPTVGDWSRIITDRQSTSSVSRDDQSLPCSTSLPQHPGISTNDAASSNGFRAYLNLEGIAASVIEDKSSDNPYEQKKHEAALIRFYDSHIKPMAGKIPDAFCLSVLWHSIFISLYARFDHLELAVGRDGFNEAQCHIEYVRAWACSQDGQRCALHAALILRELGRMSLGTEPPIHVPRIIFRAALVWFCYTTFGLDALETFSQQQQQQQQHHQTVSEFAELKMLGINCQRLSFEANGFKSSRPKPMESSTLCSLVDILGRVGHWGISRRFASILTLLLPGVAESKRYER